MNAHFRIACANDIDDQYLLTQQLIAIDYKCFGDIEVEDEGTAEQWTKIRNACFVHVIYENDIPLGYIDFVSLKSEGIEKLLKGDLRDGEVPEYANINPSSFLTLYVAVIAILPEYRRKGLSKFLWNKSREYFISNKYSIETLYSNVWTDEGWNFFNHFEIELKNQDKNNHRIIQVKLKNNQLPQYK